MLITDIPSIIINALITYIEYYLVLLNELKLNPITNIIFNIIMYLAFTAWSIFSAYHIMGLISYKLYKVKRGNIRQDAEIVIVTRGNDIVRDSLNDAINHNRKYGNLTILTEDDANMNSIHNIDIIRVPKDYRNDLIGKGRALNYFVENFVKDDKWYIFLDDDNLLLTDDIFYEISVYEKLGYVASNPILIPRLGSSKITYIMDWVRYFDDLLTFKTFTGLMGKPLIGMHGEMFTVKGSILREIKFEHKTLTEDFRFASELVKHNYKTWQSKSKISILSPNTLTDLYKQRGRWFRGLCSDIRYTNSLVKALMGIRLLSWIIGIFGSWAFAVLWLIFEPFWYAIIGGIIYWYIYAYGIKKINMWEYLVLIPLYGILESFSWTQGLFRREYVVIDKNHRAPLRLRK